METPVRSLNPRQVHRTLIILGWPKELGLNLDEEGRGSNSDIWTFGLANGEFILLSPMPRRVPSVSIVRPNIC
jgi:hypothetical protein